MATTCHIDGDILMYECSACGERKDPETGEVKDLGFDVVLERFNQVLYNIEEACWPEGQSTLYLTGDTTLWKMVNKRRRFRGEEEVEFEDNFRKAVATSKPYKGTRHAEKPKYYSQLRIYTMSNPDLDVVVAFGIEADDAISMAITADKDAVCCTRDKDLRMVAGQHYGWPCGEQPAFRLDTVSELGELDFSPLKKKLKGTGSKFFWSQMLTGDTVDNIGGLPKVGPVKAYEVLNELESDEDCYQVVKSLYQSKMGDDWETYFLEQADLLYMVREVDEEGKLLLYTPPDWEDWNVNKEKQKRRVSQVQWYLDRS